MSDPELPTIFDQYHLLKTCIFIPSFLFLEYETELFKNRRTIRDVF